MDEGKSGGDLGSAMDLLVVRQELKDEIDDLRHQLFTLKQAMTAAATMLLTAVKAVPVDQPDQSLPSQDS